MEPGHWLPLPTWSCGWHHSPSSREGVVGPGGCSPGVRDMVLAQSTCEETSGGRCSAKEVLNRDSWAQRESTEKSLFWKERIPGMRNQPEKP